MASVKLEFVLCFDLKLVSFLFLFYLTVKITRLNVCKATIHTCLPPQTLLFFDRKYTL